MKPFSILIVLLILNFNKSYCQSIETLKKYSYPLFGYNKGYLIENNVLKRKLVHGSCFFIRYNNKLYLISAAHALTGLNHKGQLKDNTYPDSLYIKLYNRYSNKEDDFKFSILELRNNIPSNFYTNHADVFAYKIKLPEKYNVLSIEKFIKNQDLNKVKYAVIYGFPIYSNSIEKCVLDEKVYHYMNTDENLNNKMMTFKVKQGVGGPGFSGAPLFYITNSNQVIFGGLAVSGVQSSSLNFALPIDIVKSLKTNQ